MYGSQLTAGTGRATKPEDSQEANKDKEGPVGGYGQGSSNGVTSLIPSPGTDVVGKEGLALTPFWRVLKDVGYDVWWLDQGGS